MSQEKKTPQSFGLNQNKIPNSITTSSYGQILTSTMDSKGGLQNIDQFRGIKLINISGGNRKVFLFQQLDENQNVVTAVHVEQQDYQQFNGVSVLPIDQIVLSLQGLKIVQIISGKLHNIVRTENGKLFSFGKSQFGSLGLGGCVFSQRPRILKKLQNKNIISIACGAHHTLALSQIGDLFSWGRGFEGQLGLLQTTQTVSSPQFIPHFFKYNHQKDVKMLRKNPIQKIACGSYHSIAIDCKGDIYCWGQARYGQTGTGRKIKEPKPVKLNIEVDGQQRKICKASGGFGHTICLTTKGQIFGWGINVKGQVGIGDLPQGIKNDQKRVKYCKAVFQPKLISKSQQLADLPKFQDITCGFSRSFAIDVDGNVWAWGGGCLGFKDKFSERGPALLTQGTDKKKFSKVFANEDTLVLFAPLSPTYFKPSLAPSKGGTQMTFFGTGFTDTGLQHAVFSVGDAAQQVKLQFDAKTFTYFCKVPDFDAQKKNIKYPAQCQVLITLDKKKYYPYDKKLLVYSQRLAMQSIQPKSGSAHGNTIAKLYMPLDPLIQQYCESITVGFKSNTKNDVENKITDWICTQGTYEQQNISCRFPNLPFFDIDDPFYIVDVSLNGQQFTNHPQTIRFYLITQTQITPNEGNDEQQTEITITGKGFFDTPFKQLTVKLQFISEGESYVCQKKVQTTWSKTQKNFKFKMPTLKWILGDINITEQLLNDARNSPLSVKLNLSKKDPIEVGNFNFIIPPPPQQPVQQTNKKDSKKGAKK